MGTSIILIMKHLFHFLTICLFAVGLTIFFLGWIFGFVLAKGFWSTFFCWIPFYSWYLVIEHIAIKYGLI